MDCKSTDPKLSNISLIIICYAFYDYTYFELNKSKLRCPLCYVRLTLALFNEGNGLTSI